MAVASQDVCSQPKQRKISSHGKRCAVFNCGNQQGDGFTLHTFPKNDISRRKWIHFVKTCRQDFGPGYDTPNKNSAICHLHFESSCYPASRTHMENLGFKANRILITGSIPTIQKPGCSVSGISRPSLPLTTTTQSATANRTSSTVTVTTTTSNVAPICSTSILPGVSKVRGAFKKREHQRVLSHILHASHLALPQPEQEAEPEPVEDWMLVEEKHRVDIGCQTVQHSHQTKGLSRKTYRSKGTQANFHSSLVSKGLQCNIADKVTTAQHVQCNMDFDETYQPQTVVSDFHVHSNKTSSESETEMNEQDDSSSYCPSSPGSSSTVTIQSPTKAAPSHRHTTSTSTCREAAMKKFVVFERELLQLFRFCHKCNKTATHGIAHIVGSMVKVTQDCGHCGHNMEWYSQPFVNDIPAGNLLMSASILFSGCLVRKALNFLRHMGVCATSERTIYNHQAAFLQPAVKATWQAWQNKYIAHAQQAGKPVTLGGDGRADSPGHSAKYGTYTLMDLELMQICNIQLVQSNEVKNSSWMELEGLKRALAQFQESEIRVEELVTDRHPQIMKYVRDEMTPCKHSIDVWHVAKGLKKKLSKLAKEKECGELSKWIHSITNHMHWVASSTPDSNVQLMREKWTSLAKHVHNIHTHSGKYFPACEHPPLDGHQRKKKWLREGTKVSIKLLEIIESKRLVKDIEMLATGPQTAALEAFHSVMNHFAPKMVAFSYEGMKTRTLLAALHFNENGGRQQAETKEGDKRFSLAFKKSKGDFTLQEIKDDQTFCYVDILMDCVVQMAARTSLAAALASSKLQPKPPGPLSTSFSRPNKEDAISNLQSRYSKSK